MIINKITKEMLKKTLQNKSKIRCVYWSSVFKQQKPKRQLKEYQKLFYTPPLININIDMILAINQLRPKATYIIAAKNGQYHKQMSNSTYNIVQCLNFIQGYKYFYKSYPALIQNITKVLVDKVDLFATGIYKPNTIKRLISMISQIDCLHGEITVELMCVYLIWSLQSSLKVKNYLIHQLNQLKQRKRSLQQRKSSIISKLNAKHLQQEKQQAQGSINSQINNINEEITKLVYQNRFVKQEDFLAGLHYCLQRGYYSQTLLTQFVENIMKKNQYSLPQIQDFVLDEKQYYYQKPLSNMQNRRAIVYCRMYNNAAYRLKILNELKNMKKFDHTFMDFIKNKQSSTQDNHSQSAFEQSPFLNEQKINTQQTSQQINDQKDQCITDRFIEESIISKRDYLKLVDRYLSFLERKDTLCYILSEDGVSQGLKILQSEFFSYLSQTPDSNEFSLTLAQVKKRYLNIFKEIFNVEKNGTNYAQSSGAQCAFQVILKLYDYQDRKQVFELLRIYERYLITKNVFDIKSLGVFYVFEKYQYKSNFVASKLFEYIKYKYRRQQYTVKQELILLGNQICKVLCLYFKLLEDNVKTILTSDQSNGSPIKQKNVSLSPTLENQKVYSSSRANNIMQQQQQESKSINSKYKQQFNQAVEIFLQNYNKVVSVIYLEKENQGFIGKGVELMFQYLRVKYFSTKTYELNLLVEGKFPEEDLRRIIADNNDAIKSHRNYVKNIYQKEFETANKQKSEKSQANLNFIMSSYYHSMFSKRSSVLNPMDQVLTMLQAMQTAIELQKLKNIPYYQDVVAVFKSIFENKKLVKLLETHQTFPQVLKRLIRISQMFKGTYKNESNKLFESILSISKYNLNNYLHTSRISIAREILNTNKSITIDEKFQPYLHCLDLNQKHQRNMRVWEQSSYSINRTNVSANIRSDILYAALMQNEQLQKTIRDQLAKIKTVKPSQNIKNMKFQLNYLEYPYLANVAINKNNELIVILIRKSSLESERPYNRVLNNYYDECEHYFRKKGNKVIIAMSQQQIKSSLKQLLR